MIHAICPKGVFNVFFFFEAEDGIRVSKVPGVQTCALPISVLASVGAFGATNGFGTANAAFPASDPLVTGVGGTQGNPYLPPLTASSCSPALSPCNVGDRKSVV